jgi:predicted permease
MQQWQTMVAALIPALGIILAGVVVRKLNWLTEEADRTLLHLTIRLLMPCLILREMTRAEFDGAVAGLLIPPALGFGLTLLGFGVAAAVALAMGRSLGLPKLADRRTFILCVGLFNYGFIPYPLARDLFPNDAVTMPTLMLFNVGVDVSLWTVGMLILTGRLSKGWWKGLLNPVVISIVAALVLKFSGVWDLIPPPMMKVAGWPIAKLVSDLASCAIPLSLLLTGATIADVWRDANFREGLGVVAGSTLLRLGILPALFLLVAWCLPRGSALANVVVIQAAMPAAMFPIIMARHYGGDAPTAVRVVIGTTLISLITTPLCLALGFAIIH